MNNQIAGTFSRWKCRSMLPLGEFMRRLQKNMEPTTKQVHIAKEEFELKTKELKEKEKRKQERRNE